MSELEQFRAEIDAIDDELIALLKKRIEVVSKVGAYKRAHGENGAFIRPGREGKMHQRIYDAFKDSDFAPEAAVSIWRLLISASTHHESPLQLGILQQEAEDLTALAQNYFGNFLECKSYPNSGTLLSDVYEGKASIAILPDPHDEASVWWHALAQHQASRLYIFAKLPVIVNSPRVQTALAVADVAPEPSGSDESYFAVQLDDTVSTSKLNSIFQQVGIQSTLINIITQAPMRWVLVKLDGFYASDDASIAEAMSNLPDAHYQWLGAHPKAIEA